MRASPCSCAQTLTGRDAPRAVSKSERTGRGFGHPVQKALMPVPKTATAAQAGGDLIQGDLR